MTGKGFRKKFVVKTEILHFLQNDRKNASGVKIAVILSGFCEGSHKNWLCSLMLLLLIRYRIVKAGILHCVQNDSVKAKSLFWKCPATSSIKRSKELLVKVETLFTRRVTGLSTYNDSSLACQSFSLSSNRIIYAHS